MNFQKILSKKTRLIGFSIIIIGALYNVLVAMVPVLVSQLVKIVENKNVEEISAIIVAYTLVMIGQVLFGYVDMRLSWRFETALKQNLRKRLLKSIMLNYEDKTQKETSLLSLLTNNVEEAEGAIEGYLNLARYIIGLLVYLVFLGTISNIGVLFVVLAANIVIYIIAKKYSSQLENYNRKYLENKSMYLQKLHSLLYNPFNINLHTRSGFQKQHFNILKDEQKSNYTYKKNEVNSLTLNSGLYIVMVLIVLFSIVLSIFRKSISIGTGIAVFQFIRFVSEMLAVILDSLVVLRGKKGGFKAINDYLDTEDKSLEEFLCLNQNIMIESISVGNIPITLKCTNLSFNKGEKIIINGSNGSGKSTFLKVLINRVSSDEKQRVFYDGITVSEIDVSEVAYYQSSKPVIFKGTFYDNISIFDSYTGDFGKVESLMKKLDMSKLIQTDNCKELSDGEKQIVEFARVFFLNRDFLIFDEAFSKIDKKRTLIIYQTLMELNNLIIFVDHKIAKYEIANKMRRIEIRNGEVTDVC